MLSSDVLPRVPHPPQPNIFWPLVPQSFVVSSGPSLKIPGYVWSPLWMACSLYIPFLRLTPPPPACARFFPAGNAQMIASLCPKGNQGFSLDLKSHDFRVGWLALFAWGFFFTVKMPSALVFAQWQGSQREYQ